jgi:hypothetical protein
MNTKCVRIQHYLEAGAEAKRAAHPINIEVEDARVKFRKLGEQIDTRGDKVLSVDMAFDYLINGDVVDDDITEELKDKFYGKPFSSSSRMSNKGWESDPFIFGDGIRRNLRPTFLVGPRCAGPARGGKRAPWSGSKCSWNPVSVTGFFVTHT